MEQATSRDGTVIAFERSGTGPAIILVVGAFNDRSTGAPLALRLEPHFTVLRYDRRGRGDSGDTAPYAVEREIEDLEALIGAAGGSADVFGYSSGAILAVEAAAQGLAIQKLALYEPPPVGPMGEIISQLSEMIAAGRRGDAVEFFQGRVVGIPAEVVAQLRNAPFRPALEKMAHTLVYEMTIQDERSLRAERLASILTPALILDGENSPPVMHQAAQWLADGLPHAQRRTLAGQGHDIDAGVVGPIIEAFFGAAT